MIRVHLPADVLVRDLWSRALTAALCQPVVGAVLFGGATLALALLEVTS